MPSMFSIGEFSKVTGLTVKALRFYDEEGVLLPSRVDAQSGYRYYGEAKVETARLIACLRGLELSLDEVKEILRLEGDEAALLEGYLDDGRVLYRGNYHPSLGTDHQLLSGLEFLALLVPHVALRFECRIHCYGAASTTIRRALGWVKKEDGERGSGEVVIAEEESGSVRLRRRSSARLIRKVWLDDPELCPHCKQPMKVLAAISSPA